MSLSDNHIVSCAFFLFVAKPYQSEDARTAVMLYRLKREEWEKDLKDRKSAARIAALGKHRLAAGSGDVRTADGESGEYKRSSSSGQLFHTEAGNSSTAVSGEATVAASATTTSTNNISVDAAPRSRRNDIDNSTVLLRGEKSLHQKIVVTTSSKLRSVSDIDAKKRKHGISDVASKSDNSGDTSRAGKRTKK